MKKTDDIILLIGIYIIGIIVGIGLGGGDMRIIQKYPTQGEKH